MDHVVAAEGHLDFSTPYSLPITVAAEHIDAFGHVNNAVYVTWLEACAWAHSAHVGLPLERCIALRRGMAVRRTIADYLAPAHLGEDLIVNNWVVKLGRLRATRHYQICRGDETIFRARVDFVCVNLDTGAPSRMPPEFLDNYRVETSVVTKMIDTQNTRLRSKPIPFEMLLGPGLIV